MYKSGNPSQRAISAGLGRSVCVRSSSYRRVRSRYDVAALGFVLLCWILLLGAAPVSSEEALGEQRVESVGENSFKLFLMV